MIDTATQMCRLFRGRRDAIAVAGIDKDGKKTFAPQAGEITPDRLADEHLGGLCCLGFYLMTPDSRVLTSCVDFDNHEGSNPEYREHVERLYMLLNSLGVPCVVELSQSGDGAHVWIFFDEPTDAWIPRAFWRACAARINVSMREVYPRQDKLSGKGYGNLVRYPLWNLSRFVDLEAEWAELDAAKALTDVTFTSGTDLSTVAFQAGLGVLAADPVLANVQIEGLSEIVPARVARLLSAGSSLLMRRWENDPIGMGDTSRSAVAMSLCCELVRSYVPTPEIGSTLRAWCGKHSYSEKGDRDDWINRTIVKAYDYVVARKEKSSTSVSTFRDAAHAYIDIIERGDEIFVPSGIAELDKLCGGGVAPGEVAIIAGRPSHGKSAVGFQWVAHAASLGIKCLVISEEMGRIQVGKRRLMSISDVPIEQWVQASAAALRRDVDDYHKGHADVYIVESCGTIDRTEEVIDQFCELYNVGLVMVDYMQLLGARTTDRYEVVTEVSRRIKQATVRSNIAMLNLCQLNRGIESRDEHTPKLSDLRESGQIEQDADKVFFTVFPSRFADAPDDLYHIYCGKNRNGPGAGSRVETTFDTIRQRVGHFPSSVLDL